MQTSRRLFLAQSAAAAGSTLLLAPLSLQAERIYSASLKAPLGLTAPDREVIAFTSRFGRAPLLTGGGVLSRLNGTTASTAVTSPLAIRAPIDRLDAFSQALGSIPFREAYAEGNTLQLTHQGVAYDVESLQTETFRSVELDYRGGRVGDLAHDSISWNASTGRLSDPHGVISSNAFRLGRVAAPADSMDQVRQWVRGWVDAANYGLEPDAEFLEFHQQVRSSTVRDNASAREVAGILITGLAGLHAGAPAATVTAFLGSPLSRTCLPVLTAEDVSVGIARHQSLNSPLRSNGGAGWIAAVFASRPPDAELIRELGITGPASSFRTRTALRQARQVLAGSPGLSK